MRMSSKSQVMMVLLLFAPLGTAGAQSTASVRMVRVAAVLEQPVGEARAVGTVNAGDVLDVLDERDGWYLVRPPAGESAREWRTGWVNGSSAEPMNPASARTPAQGPPLAQNSAEPTANRKGFIIGGGVGGGWHRTPGAIAIDRFGRITSIGSANSLTIPTNVFVGYAASDQIVLFYSNRANFTTSDRYDVLGVTGFGTTYMLRRTAPTTYVTGSIGAGFGGNVVQSTVGETGVGFSIGGGYEIRRHLSVESDALFVRLGGGENHTVLRATLNYTFY